MTLSAIMFFITSDNCVCFPHDCGPCLFVSNSQVIGCEDRLRNDLYCVGWVGR